MSTALNNPRLRDAVVSAYGRSMQYLHTQQKANGAFAGEVVWNPMLTCQYVMLMHVLGRPIDCDRARRIRYSLEHQVRSDGGWGMHPDSPSYLFHTTLGYVALRLLDVDVSDPLCANALRWIHGHGGAYKIPTWGRVWLAILGLYPWSGVQPILPELWLLPEASPVHPRRLYCHMRLIYLGMSFIYGSGFVCPSDRRMSEIRQELYPRGYDEKLFAEHRDDVAPTDLHETPSKGLKVAFAGLRALEKLSPAVLRRKALAAALEHILFEFRSTDYVCLSPVNGMPFCLALHINDPNHPELDKAIKGLEYWMWEDEREGLRVAGARSDIWDTSFIVSALCEGPKTPTTRQIVRDACRWLPTAQIQEEILGGARHHRQSAYGGFGFADEHHPWPVSDCTAEALEALMRAEETGLSDREGRLDFGRKLAAVQFILDRANDDGGFGSYESRRGSMRLRHYNPAEIYGNCMLEYSYTECTGSCASALAYTARALRSELPPELAAHTEKATDDATRFVLAQQHANGGWPGFWGINFTYGTMFAVRGLLEAGVPTTHPAIVRACRFLLDAQRPDGGWGEAYEGMLEGHNVQLTADSPSLSVQTAWAVLTLMEASPREHRAIERGIRYLLTLQSETGQWPAERASGCFFNTAALDYTLYRQTFPTWALARYLKLSGAAIAGSQPAATP